MKQHSSSAIAGGAGRALLILSILVLGLVQGCDGSNPEQPESWAGLDRIVLRHPSGLVLELPDGLYAVEETVEGYRIEPGNAAGLRNPFEIRIALSSDARPEGEWPESRHFEGREARFRVDVEEGGSGGELQRLIAWVNQGERHVRLEQLVQVEPPAQADFSDAWAILAFSRGP